MFSLELPLFSKNPKYTALSFFFRERIAKSPFRRFERLPDGSRVEKEGFLGFFVADTLEVSILLLDPFYSPSALTISRRPHLPSQSRHFRNHSHSWAGFFDPRSRGFKTL